MWQITQDKMDNGKMNGAQSFDFDETKWSKSKEKGNVDEFRLLDDDGEVYFYGEYNQSNGSETAAFAPLDELGAAYGCTELQYKDRETGEWKSL